VRSNGAACERRLVVLQSVQQPASDRPLSGRDPGTVLRYGALRSAVKVLAVEFPIQPTPIAIMTLNIARWPGGATFHRMRPRVAKPLAKRKS